MGLLRAQRTGPATVIAMPQVVEALCIQTGSPLGPAAIVDQNEFLDAQGGGGKRQRPAKLPTKTKAHSFFSAEAVEQMQMQRSQLLAAREEEPAAAAPRPQEPASADGLKRKTAASATGANKRARAGPASASEDGAVPRAVPGVGAEPRSAAEGRPEAAGAEAPTCPVVAALLQKVAANTSDGELKQSISKAWQDMDTKAKAPYVVMQRDATIKHYTAYFKVNGLLPAAAAAAAGLVALRGKCQFSVGERVMVQLTQPQCTVPATVTTFNSGGGASNNPSVTVLLDERLPPQFADTAPTPQSANVQVKAVSRPKQPLPPAPGTGDGGSSSLMLEGEGGEAGGGEAGESEAGFAAYMFLAHVDDMSDTEVPKTREDVPGLMQGRSPHAARTQCLDTAMHSFECFDWSTRLTPNRCPVSLLHPRQRHVQPGQRDYASSSHGRRRRVQRHGRGYRRPAHRAGGNARERPAAGDLVRLRLRSTANEQVPGSDGAVAHRPRLVSPWLVRFRTLSELALPWRSADGHCSCVLHRRSVAASSASSATTSNSTGSTSAT